MKKIGKIIAAIWFVMISISAPAWFGLIYMNITGHGKGYGYDMGSEADIAVFFGVVELLFWLAAFLPVFIWFCKKCFHIKKFMVILPVLSFLLLFCVGVICIGKDAFFSNFNIQVVDKNYIDEVKRGNYTDELIVEILYDSSIKHKANESYGMLMDYKIDDIRIIVATEEEMENFGADGNDIFAYVSWSVKPFFWNYEDWYIAENGVEDGAWLRFGYFIYVQEQDGVYSIQSEFTGW